jgi:hypothetical protein
MNKFCAASEARLSRCLPLGPAVNDFRGNPFKAAQIHFNE